MLRTLNDIVRSHRDVEAMLAKNFVTVSEDHNYILLQFRQHKSRTENRNVLFIDLPAGNMMYNIPLTIDELHATFKATMKSSLDQISYSVIKSLHDTKLKLLVDAFVEFTYDNISQRGEKLQQQYRL